MPAKTTAFIYVVPVLAIASTSVRLDELPTVDILAGSAITVLGAFLVNRRGGALPRAIDTTRQWCYILLVNDSQIAYLVDIGLNRYEASVYVALLERGDYAPASVAQRAEVPRQRIYDVLGSLEEKGFCTVKSTRPRVYAAIDPHVALSHFLASRDRELHEELSRIEERVGTAIAALGPVYEAGSKENDPFQYLEVLRTPRRIAQRALELATASVSEVNSFVKLPMILTDEQNIRFIHEPLSRGIRYRSIYDNQALAQPDVHAFAVTCVRLGQEIRVRDNLPVKMHAFDGRTALLSLQDPVGGNPSFTAIITHHAGMVEALNIAFRALWTDAQPFQPEGGDEREHRSTS